MKTTLTLLTALLLAPMAALHGAEPSPALQPPAASVTVSDLRCGGQVEPLGIDDEELLLGWQIKGDTRGLRQTAYRVLAASSPDLLLEGKADLWDSGKIESDQSQWVKYSGKAPASAQRVYWRVEVWDGAGRKAVSTPSWFETGLKNALVIDNDSAGTKLTANLKASPALVPVDVANKNPGVGFRGGAGTTVITWGAADCDTVELWVQRDDQPAPSRMASAGGREPGNAKAPWITANAYKFFLYEGPDKKRLIASLEVKGVDKNDPQFTAPKKTREISTDSVTDGQGPAIYLLDIFQVGNRRLLHWKYNGGMLGWKETEVADIQGKVLARIKRPDDTFDTSALPPSTILMITPVTEDGQRGVTRSISMENNNSQDVRAFGRIGIRSAAGKAEFFNRATGRTFHPRGFNYVPLRRDHSLFQAATSNTTADYDPLDAESALRLMGDNGYNTVRIFLAGRNRINPGIAGELNTEGLYTPYLDNLADFLARAARRGIYVIMNFCDMDLPLNEYFQKRARGGDSSNRILLSRAGVQAHQEQAVSTLAYLKAKNPALLKVILGVQFNNEVSVKLAQWPFDAKSPVTLANGKSYDMSESVDRLRAMEEGLLYYWKTMRDAVKSVDSELLTCEGAYTAYAVGRDLRSPRGYLAGEVAPGFEWDLEHGSRCPPSVPLLARSPLDFIDLHIYPTKPMDGSNKEAAESLESSDFQRAVDAGLLKNKPLILGEFGSSKSNGTDTGDATLVDAWRRFDQTRKFACHDKHFSGWLIWTFDSFEQREIYNAMADDGRFLKSFASFSPWKDHDRNAPILDPEQATTLPLKLATVHPTGRSQGFLAPLSQSKLEEKQR